MMAKECQRRKVSGKADEVTKKSNHVASGVRPQDPGKTEAQPAAPPSAACEQTGGTPRLGGSQQASVQGPPDSVGGTPGPLRAWPLFRACSGALQHAGRGRGQGGPQGGGR